MIVKHNLDVASFAKVLAENSDGAADSQRTNVFDRIDDDVTICVSRSGLIVATAGVESSAAAHSPAASGEACRTTSVCSNSAPTANVATRSSCRASSGSTMVSSRRACGRTL
jgi:hypothetical protein